MNKTINMQLTEYIIILYIQYITTFFVYKNVKKILKIISSTFTFIVFIINKCLSLIQIFIIKIINVNVEEIIFNIVSKMSPKVY